MKSTPFFIFGLVVFGTVDVLARTPSSAPSSPQERNILLERELVDREIARQLATVQNQADLASYMLSIPKDSPLLLLSDGARDRFIQSIVFTDHGVASFQYADLRAELSASEVYRLLSIFGLQNSTKSIPDLRIESAADEAVIDDAAGVGPLADYVDYKCRPPATCTRSMFDICIGDNCGIIEP